MVYSSEEKARMDRLVEAFSEYIAASPEFDIAYTEKSGYLWLVIAEDAERIYFPIRSFDEMLDMLFHDVLFEHISRLPEPLTEEKSWKDSSVHILLNGLLSKGAIKEAGFVKRSKTFGRTFLPTMTREEYFAMTIFSHRYKPEMTGLIAALLQRPEVTEEILNEVAALAETRKSEIR